MSLSRNSRVKNKALGYFVLAEKMRLTGWYFNSSLAWASEANTFLLREAVHMETDVKSDMDDGYRWRKYGQRVAKGNPNPRIIALGSILVAEGVKKTTRLETPWMNLVGITNMVASMFSFQRPKYGHTRERGNTSKAERLASHNP